MTYIDWTMKYKAIVLLFKLKAILNEEIKTFL